MTDKHVDAVIRKHRERQAAGMAKYGVSTERRDLSPLQWLDHAQEEAMDMAIYLEVLREQVAELQRGVFSR